MGKRVFITSMVLALNAVSGVAIWQLGTGGMVLSWFGALMASLPLPLALNYWLVSKRTSRTSAGFPLVVWPTAAGSVLAALPLLGVGGPGSWLAAVLAAASLGSVLAYVYWYSVFGRAPSAALAVGQRLPQFVLENTAGVEVCSSSFVGSPSVLMFYRGNWCPLCMAQIKEIAALYRELDARGAKVRLVSPQPHDNTQQLAARFDVPFDFLVDRDNRAATALGIASPDGIPVGLELMGYETQTVMPTVVITDAEGTILMCDETDNYRVRPEPETFLRVLDAHAAGA
ncbi:MAG: peroxiredoxin family protein [Deltaproteobacteria bacterium]|nr:peroxiredoxin family protein [Deltaproteobacteria bacterium]